MGAGVRRRGRSPVTKGCCGRSADARYTPSRSPRSGRARGRTGLGHPRDELLWSTSSPGSSTVESRVAWRLQVVRTYQVGNAVGAVVRLPTTKAGWSRPAPVRLPLRKADNHPGTHSRSRSPSAIAAARTSAPVGDPLVGAAATAPQVIPTPASRALTRAAHARRVISLSIE